MISTVFTRWTGFAWIGDGDTSFTNKKNGTCNFLNTSSAQFLHVLPRCDNHTFTYVGGCTFVFGLSMFCCI